MYHLDGLDLVLHHVTNSVPVEDDPEPVQVVVLPEDLGQVGQEIVEQVVEHREAVFPVFPPPELQIFLTQSDQELGQQGGPLGPPRSLVNSLRRSLKKARQATVSQQHPLK